MFRLHFIFSFISVCVAQQYGEYGLCTTPNLVTTENKTYFFGIYHKLNWYDAYSSCFRLGMQLITIESENELNHIYEWMKYNDFEDETFWTSGVKLKGKWMWIGNSIEINSLYWHKNKPEYDGFEWIYLSVLQSQLRFSSVDSRTTSHFICQYELCE